MPEENNIQEVTNKSRVEQLLEAWAGGEQIELWAPQSNIERILMNILGATGVDINPIQSRNEALLLEILENGGGSGGGGSSDISTAEVTGICTGGQGYEAYFGIQGSDLDKTVIFAIDDTYGIKTDNLGIICQYGSPSTKKIYVIPDNYIVVWYQGDAPTPETYTVTGSAEVISLSDDPTSPYYGVKVTGDCTISVVGVLGH